MTKPKVTNEYRAVSGSRYTRKDATVLGPILSKLFKEGCRTPRDIIHKISSKRLKFCDPLRAELEWNDKNAADAYRCEQVRKIIQAIEVKVVGNTGPMWIRAFHSIPIKVKPSEKSRGCRQPREFISVKEAIENEGVANTLQWQALHDLRLFKSRYATYLSVFQQKLVDDLLDSLNSDLDKAEKEVAVAAS